MLGIELPSKWQDLLHLWLSCYMLGDLESEKQSVFWTQANQTSGWHYLPCLFLDDFLDRAIQDGLSEADGGRNQGSTPTSASQATAGKEWRWARRRRLKDVDAISQPVGRAVKQPWSICSLLVAVIWATRTCFLDFVSHVKRCLVSRSCARPCPSASSLNQVSGLG